MPYIDAGVAAVALIALVSTLVLSDSQLHDALCEQYDASCNPNRAGIATLFGIITAADGAGAYYGFTKTDECRNASAGPAVEAPVATPPPPTGSGSGSGAGSGSGVREMPAAPEGLPLP